MSPTIRTCRSTSTTSSSPCANDVGEDVVGGAVAKDADTAETTITIYGTDRDLLSDAADRIALDERNRISLVESQYSVSDLEGFASEAQADSTPQGSRPTS